MSLSTTSSRIFPVASASDEVAYLESILAWHRNRAAKDPRDPSDVMSQALSAETPRRAFVDALRVSSRLAVIAEVKRKSPSKGVINAELNPAALAAEYESGGASCLSVLTDSPHFGGSAADLADARAACSIPVLRKDFTVDSRDIMDARLMGADAVLLIVAALTDVELTSFLRIARELQIDALVEVHDESELSRALTAGAALIGVNQRDLNTFAVDSGRAESLASLIPDHVLAVAESGINGSADALRCAEAGYRAVLVGEHLVRSTDRVSALAELRVPLPS